VTLSFKELIVVWVIAAVIFRLARPIALKFIHPDDLSRRRNSWFALTAVAFLAPGFWVFALVAIPLLIWAGRRDSNPCAVYLLLFQVIPPLEIPVPMIGMQHLLSLNMFLLLSFCVLTPLALRTYRLKGQHPENALQFMDLCLLAYGLLASVFYLRAMKPNGTLYPVSSTESLRHAFVFFFDAFIPYYVVSRAGADRRKLRDMLATYCLCCAVLAAIAVFETAWGWLLYGGMVAQLSTPAPGAFYLMRGGGLRAMASTGHPMALAHLLVLAFGLWLYLQTRLDSRLWKLGGVILFWTGLFAAFTRGALLGAVVVFFLFAALRPRGASRLFSATGAAVVVAVLIYLSPLGDKIVSVVPWFGGKMDAGSITYRERLWERSWQIIKESPFLGDQDAIPKMQDLRQGEGIVDVINTYAGVLLNDGFLGLSLFLGFILTALLKAWAGNRRTLSGDPDLSVLGAALVACLVATLIMILDSSLTRGPARMFYVFAGFAAGYSVLVRASLRSQSTVDTRPIVQV